MLSAFDRTWVCAVPWPMTRPRTPEKKFFVPLSPLTSPMPKYEFRPMPLRGSVVVKNSGSNQFLERDGHHVVEGLEISRVVGRRAVLT